MISAFMHVLFALVLGFSVQAKTVTEIPPKQPPVQPEMKQERPPTFPVFTPANPEVPQLDQKPAM